MKWRLTSELLAYVISGKERIYLSAIDKKICQTNVIKLMAENNEPSYEELRIYENQFEIKFSGDKEGNLILLAKSDEFPTSGWYEIVNFWKSGIWNFLGAHTLENGCFPEGTMFEVGFEDTQPLVTFVEPGMANYKEYFEEMRRRINCELCKKTTKYTPGHRYDSLEETYYILDVLYSRRVDQFNSDFTTELGKMKEVAIYTNVLYDTDKDISTVLKTRHFGDNPEDLKILYTKKSLVDAGEVLENNYTGDIQDYWTDLFRNSMESKSYIKDAFESFSLCKGTVIDKTKVPTEDIKDYLSEFMFNIILNNWNLKNLRSDLVITDQRTDAENVESIIKLLSSTIKDGNFLKNLYYPNLFGALGINLKELATETLHSWVATPLDSDFDTYLKYSSYYSNPMRKETDKNTSRQREKSTRYKLDIVTLKDLYGESSELKDTIIECINKVRSNYGLGASEYEKINIGTRKEPLEYIICELTLEDIIKLKKGVSGLSETLKNEIMKRHFVWVQVVFDKDGDIK
jgi:hypothetical protein